MSWGTAATLPRSDAGQLREIPSFPCKVLFDPGFGFLIGLSTLQPALRSGLKDCTQETPPASAPGTWGRAVRSSHPARPAPGDKDNWVLGRTERFKGLFKCDRGGNEEFEKPKSPQPPYRARGGQGDGSRWGGTKGRPPEPAGGLTGLPHQRKPQGWHADKKSFLAGHEHSLRLKSIR